MDQPKFITDVISSARSFGHPISTVHFEASTSQANQVRPILNLLSKEKVQVELTDVDVRSDILCAARVIANRDNLLHFTDVA